MEEFAKLQASKSALGRFCSFERQSKRHAARGVNLTLVDAAVRFGGPAPTAAEARGVRSALGGPNRQPAKAPQLTDPAR